MKLGNTNLSRLVRTFALGVGLMGAVSCGAEDAKSALCEGECEAEGFAQGNASITGVSSVDGFFSAALNFTGTAKEISANIKAELDGLKADLELDPAETDLGAAIKAKLMADFQASIEVEAQPARCDIDASASIEASAKCQAEASCEVMADPGKASFECHGGCDVEASAMVSCGAEVTASCTFQGPAVACEGSCEGTCTVDANVEGGCEGSCSGTCNGTCEGTCEGGTGEGGTCNGTCNGTCKGTCSAECRIEGAVAAQCKGKCSGSCTVSGPMLDCTGAVEARCEGSAEASVTCNGKCDGEFEPPMVSADCEAKASCDAQAKAEASVKVECTPPSVDVKVVVAATLTAEAQADLDFKLAALKARLPKILAALKKGTIVFEAGSDLVTAGEGAVDGALKAFSEGDVSAGAKIKLVTCAPKEFKAAATAVKSASAELSTQVQAAASVQSGLSG